MDPITIAGIAAVVIISITSHEAAHAFVADKCGDPTARERGRVTLNPLPHIDPVMTILVPGLLLFSGAHFIFGGAKPVPVRIDQLREPRRDWALVGAAGPAMNLLLALLLSAILAVLHASGAVAVDGTTNQILSVGIFANVLLAVFNLLPIPPLDGSRIVQRFLSGSALRGYLQLERWGLFVLIGLILFVPALQEFVAKATFWVIEVFVAPFGLENAVFSGLNATFGG